MCFHFSGIDPHIHIQKALHLHLRILSQLCSPNDVPPKVSGNSSVLLQARNADAAKIQSSVDSAISKARNSPREAETMYEGLQHAISHVTATDPNSKISRDLRRMLGYKDHIVFAYSAVLSLGLPRWMPDVYCKNPSSPYNLLHERVALTTFELMCTSYAYTACNVNLEYFKQPLFIQKVRS